MPSSASPSIDHLEQLWASLIELCAGFSDEEWRQPTGCPGWSVQDNVSHLIDYEARALGRPVPPGRAVPRAHTRNALGEGNEVGVEHRRGLAGAEVLAELQEVTAARSAQLRGLTEDDLLEEVATPAGPGTVATMLRLRVMDTWAHEQDIRRALARPGHDRGPAVEEAVGHLAGLVPVVVAKRAGAPDGTVVRFEVDGAHRSTIEVVDGRGRVADEDPGTWSVRLAMPPATFVALVGGRSDPPDDVVIEGDAELGGRIVAALGFMP